MIAGLWNMVMFSPSESRHRRPMPGFFEMVSKIEDVVDSMFAKSLIWGMILLE